MINHRLLAIGFAAGVFSLPGSLCALTASNVPLPPERPGTAAAAEDVTAASGGETADAELSAPGAVMTSNGIPLPRFRPAEAGPSSADLIAAGGFSVPVISEATAAQVRAAMNALSSKRFDDALAIQDKIDDPAAKTLIEFLYVRDYSLSAPYKRIEAFLDNNPDWPNQELIRKRFEVALLAQRADPDDVLKAFAEKAPISSAGTVVYATALDKAGKLDRAHGMVRALWRSASLTQGEENLVLDRFGDVLTRDDHKARMDMLLYNGETSAALRVAKKLGGDELKLAEARIAVIRRSRVAGSVLDTLPDGVKQDPGYLLSKVQWYRRTGKEEEAAKLLLTADFPDDALVDPDEWALERRIIARELIEKKQFKAAYDLVSEHAAESAVDRLENEWHAGWLALRYLNDTKAAAQHFGEILNIAKTPISTARGHYWLGRAVEAAGDIESATKHYIDASRYPSTYYGQLALDRIGRTTVPAPKKPIMADTARRIVCERDSVRAMRILHYIGREDDAARYMISMANETDDPLTLIGLSETAEQMGLTWGTVWIGKRAMQAGALADAYAFASGRMPDYPRVGGTIDPAVVYAIARQESVFNPAAISPAGARGLMQMMPATARATARSVGKPYDEKRLTADAEYNAMLGAAHLAELAEDYGNAYALVFAAYNAGGGRVKEWIERFGDPRKGEIDPVDWVELIPFNETRNYVQRVMEGLQVYRAQLHDHQQLLIADDLRLPADYGQAVTAVAADTTGGDVTSGVFSGFNGGPQTGGGATGGTALGFGGGN